VRALLKAAHGKSGMRTDRIVSRGGFLARTTVWCGAVTKFAPPEETITIQLLERLPREVVNSQKDNSDVTRVQPCRYLTRETVGYFCNNVLCAGILFTNIVATASE
jgi:hypothetical protein